MGLREETESACGYCCIAINVRRMKGNIDCFPELICPQCGRQDKNEFMGSSSVEEVGDTMKIFRIEHEDSERSLWYRPDGTYDPFINRLTEGNSRTLPMDFDSRFYDFGTKWFSACYSVENMQQWFSDLDAYELMRSDYRLYEITAKDTRNQEHEVIFTQEGVLLKREIPLGTIWDISKFSKDNISIRN